MRAIAVNVLLVGCVLAQLAFSLHAAAVKPHWDIVPPVPSPLALQASAFGDAQFLYRVLVLDFQNFGDTGGRLTPLKDYNIAQVVRWMSALDALDINANHHPMLAMRYFSQSQDRSVLRPLIAYIQQHAAANPSRKWFWLGDAVRLASVRLGDRQLALDVATQLSSYDFPDMAPTAHQYRAYMLESIGDYAEAAAEMRRIAERLRGRVVPEEEAWMESFILAMATRAQANSPLP